MGSGSRPAVLLAPDKFKGSLTATQVAEAIADGVRDVCPESEIRSVPVADGGDGTLAAAAAAGFTLVPVDATGPTGTRVATQFARDGATAIVELADVSGLVRLPGDKNAPMTATSRGAGEVAASAIAQGCTEIVLGLGGSASTDGGAGLVSALGARLLTADGREGADGGAGLRSLARIELSQLRERIGGVRFVVASDVDNPLTGISGAAAVYGPQKGAGREQVCALDHALDHWANLVAAATGVDRRRTPGAGAAGGVGLAALAILGADLRPGIELVLDLVGFADRLAGADLVVVGEGALDEQTLRGKAPAGVAAVARAAGVSVVAVCGQTDLSMDRLRTAGIEAAYALTDVEPDVSRCIAEPAPILTRLGRRLAEEHLRRPTDLAQEPDPP